MNEMTWIEEHFYEQALGKGISIGEARGEVRGREQERQSIFLKLVEDGMDRSKAATITGINL